MPFARFVAHTLDWAMCAAMYRLQKRHRLTERSLGELAEYVQQTEPLGREEYFAAPEVGSALENSGSRWHWPSPVQTAFPKNDRVQVRLFPCARGWEAPTVLFLHALMSASDWGYARWAATFNARGWNACFIHLPFHYSRVPAGHRNGELAITPDLVRNAQGFRQAVSELRQLMALLRARGGSDFGLWASSYGGWVGALLASVEEFRFVALMEPLVDVEHAIWHSPAGRGIRQELNRHGISHSFVERHYHLTSPQHGLPKGAANIGLFAGEFDRIAPLAQLEKLRERWPASELIRLRQGHFGYRMMPAAWQWLNARECL